MFNQNPKAVAYDSPYWQNAMAALQQAPPPPVRRSSFLTSLIPTGTSLLGGALGSVVAPGVGTAIGGAGGAVLGKKLQDMITGENSSLGSYASEAAFGALGGLGKAFSAAKGAKAAVTAGEGLNAASKILRYGEEGAQTLKGFQGLSMGEKAVEAEIANRGVQGSGLIGKINMKANKIGDAAMYGQAGGLTRQTAESAVRDVGKMRELGYSSLSKASEHAPAITGRLENPGVITKTKDALLAQGSPVQTGGFLDEARSVIGKNPDLIGPAEKNVLTQLNKIADKYGFAGDAAGIGQTSAVNYNNAMREVQDIGYKLNRTSPARKTLLDIGNTMRDPLEKSLSTITMGNNVKDSMISELKARGVNNPKLFTAINNAETAGELSAIEAPFVTAGKMSKEGIKSELMTGATAMNPSSGKGITKMGNDVVGSLIGNPIRSGIAKGSNLISKLTSGGVNAPLSTEWGLAGQTAKSMAKAQLPARFISGQLSGKPEQASAQSIDPETGQPMADTMQTNPDGSFSPTSASNMKDSFQTNDPSALNPPTNNVQEQLMTAAQHALASGDTKGLDNIMKVAALHEKMSKTDEKKLSAAQQARKDALTSAMASLDVAPHNLASSGGAQGLRGEAGKIPWLGKFLDPQAASYTNTKIEMATQLAKAITGGSRAPESVIQAYMHSLPDINDTPEYAQAKIGKLRAELQAQAKRFGYNDLMGSDNSNSASPNDILNLIGAR